MTNRRRFMTLAAASALALRSGRPIRGAASGNDRGFEHGEPLRECLYGQVTLEAGLHEAQLEQTHNVLMELSEDSLLRPFRLRSGLPAPGCNLGGWYSTEEYGGETLGQWISALSRYYAISRDQATRQKVDRLVLGFSRAIEPTGKLYGHNVVTTGAAYMYDKFVCGLMDAHQFAGQAQALDTLARATTAVRAHLPGRAVDYNPEDTGAHESYTIPENQLIAWQRGASDMHLEMGKQYLYHSFFDPLAEGHNVLGGRHAYSHVNALCSAMKAYFVFGDKKYLDAARNGFLFVEQQSFATGGWGPNETFLPSPAAAWSGIPAITSLHESLTRSHRHFETPCCSYAHLKLTRYLLRATGAAPYGDSMERIMYNTVLGALPLLQDGRAFYYSDYNPDGHKFYFDGSGGAVPAEWPCCSGTLSQIAADYRLGIYFHDSAGVFVNLFIPSTVTWLYKGAKVTLTQSGSYPLGEAVTAKVIASRPVEFSLRIRIPAWCHHAAISINGRPVAATISAGTFFTIHRQWRSGDVVEMELAREIRLESIDSQHPNTVAVCYGPLVLFSVCTDTPQLTRNQVLTARRSDPKASEWFVDLPNGRPLRLVPFWSITSTERYTTYLTVT